MYTIFIMLLPKLVKSVPSSITLTSLALGLWSIKFTLGGNIIAAITCIIISVILDGMDGKLARYLNTANNFGATLDTLADFASFGIAPPVLIYYTFLIPYHHAFWLCGLFFTLCMSLRLARFSVAPAKNHLFFIGIPAPAGALLSLLPIFLSLTDILHLPFSFYGYWLLIIGVLLISKIPTFAITKFKIPQDWLTIFSLCMMMLISACVVFPLHMLCIINILYLCTFPFSYTAYKKCHI